MNEEYCVIYGRSDENPGPFIIAVTKDQNMINGFREEHYQHCVGAEILSDGFYNDLASDFEISYNSGHYITPVMMTQFMEYLTSVFNQFHQLFDVFDRELDKLRFSENDQDIIDIGFELLRDHLMSMTYTMNYMQPYDYNLIGDSVYASVLNIEECLEAFLSSYQPIDYMIF